MERLQAAVTVTIVVTPDFVVDLPTDYCRIAAKVLDYRAIDVQSQLSESRVRRAVRVARAPPLARTADINIG
jgi:hypothetical protein